MSNDLPTYIHTCSECTFLGNYTYEVNNKPIIYDLYFCIGKYPTVIYRYSSKPEEYSSGITIALALEKSGNTLDPLVEALRRARKADLFPIMCKQCKTKEVCYYGAIFCGAACTARYEANEAPAASSSR